LTPLNDLTSDHVDYLSRKKNITWHYQVCDVE